MPTQWTTILPDPDRLHLIRLTATEAAIAAIVTTVAAYACCPLCGQPSSHVHSRYVRSVADVPWHDVPFRLRLQVRRFFCDASPCVRHIFTERLPGLVAPYARRTQRLDVWLRAIGFALGGEEGARLLRVLGLSEAHGHAASPDTLLRRVRATPDPAAPLPRVVGVDDWCFLRGRRYGAMLVDLERHCPLDLLPNRESETLANWLKAHPSITVISRDRGGSFAEGATRGAPQAAQVADRFHLLKNLVEAFQQLLGREHLALRAAAEATMGSPLLPATRPLTAPVREARATARARRQERYETVRRLRAEGKPIYEIALILRMGHNTIQRLLQAETCPVPARCRPRTTLLTAFEPYLRERWNSGEQNGKQLLREIQAQGYHGGESTLYGLLGRWRTGKRHSGPYAPQRELAPPVLPPLSIAPRVVSWRLLRPAAERSPVEQAYVEDLLHRSTVVATMSTAVRRFFDLLRERRSDALDAWVANAKASGIPELSGFAEGLRRDDAAIRAAFELPWSHDYVAYCTSSLGW